MFTKLIKILQANPKLKTVTKYLSTKNTIRVTRFGKYRKNARAEDFRIQVGRPNYSARQFIKLCVKAGEPFPVKRIQYQLYPVKRK